MPRPMYYPCGWERGLAIAINTTAYAGLFNSNTALSTTENERQSVLRPGGVITRAGFYVTSNNLITTNTVATLRVNGVDTGLTVTILANTPNRWYHSSGGPVTIADNDKVCWKIASPNTSGSLTITNAYFEGICSGSVDAQWWIVNPTGSANGVTRYGLWMGPTAFSAGASVYSPAGTVRYLELMTGTNGRAVVDTFKFYRNGAADANLLKSTTASTPGPYEEATQSVNVSAGDTVGCQLIWGASATAMRIGLGVAFEPASDLYPMWLAWQQAVSPSTTNYAQLGGNARSYANEADVQTYWLTPGVLSNFYASPGTNGITGTSYMRLRKNGGQVLEIPILGSDSSPVGPDTAQVRVAAGDLLNWVFVTGAGGTTVGAPHMSFTFSPSRAPLPFQSTPRFLGRRF